MTTLKPFLKGENDRGIAAALKNTGTSKSFNPYNSTNKIKILGVQGRKK